MAPQFDVIAIGNAIVDLLAHVPDGFPEAHDVPRGGMVLIDSEKAAAMTRAMPGSEQVAGGSAGNSMVCLSRLGGAGGFVGKVANGELGDAYRRSMEEAGVQFIAAPLDQGPPTGRCHIAVTADAERSMATYLGAAGEVSEADIDDDMIRRAEMVFFEGYLFDGELPRSAFEKAAAIAHKAGKRAALTLSDVGVVERNRDELIRILEKHVDLIFANEDEARALFGHHETPAELAAEMAKLVPFGAITCSERGSIVYGPDQDATTVPAVAPVQLVDTTGAGDAYAGGFFYGFTRGKPLPSCATLGSVIASEVISHMGPRPVADIRQMAADRDLL